MHHILLIRTTVEIGIKKCRLRRRRLKGIYSRSDTNRTGGEGLSVYYPRLLHCLDQMVAVVLLSQHRVSSSKTVRPRAPCGVRCIGHTVRTWSAVCSEAPHSQFGEEARPHLCMDEWNRPTPVRRRLSLTQTARVKPIPTLLALVPGTKARSLEALSQYSVFHLWLVHSVARMPSLARLSKRFRAPGTNGRLDLSLTWPLSEDPLKRPYKIWSGSRDPRQAKESVAPSRQSSAGWMPESTGRWFVGVGRRIQWLCARRHSKHWQWGECEHCDTRLAHSTQLLSRLETGWLCEVLKRSSREYKLWAEGIRSRSFIWF